MIGEKEPQEFCLMQDDSSHWYVVPLGRCEEFGIAAEDITVDDLEDIPGVVRIGGSPSLVRFTNWRIAK